MKILLTGANGYIGKRLLPILVRNGHQVVCCVRDKNRFNPPKALLASLEIIEVDFLNVDSLQSIPKDIDGAYYLIHSMSSASDYDKLELQAAKNFRTTLNKTRVRHVVFLSGISNAKVLSKHLASRTAVENNLNKGRYSLTTFRAGIIIGSGSASFEIVRDIVEKLPVMITPKWLNTRCQPISISNVISYLEKGLFKQELYNQNFDIGGRDILTYKEILMGYADVRKLKRYILTVPVMTPKLSSYWLYFVTSTSFRLASALVSSMKVEVICRNHPELDKLGITAQSYSEALHTTFNEVLDDKTISSWKDSLISGTFESNISTYLRVPTYGCFKDEREETIIDLSNTLNKIWSIGGVKGWYFANWLWRLRGFIDKLFGGVGLRRGRTRQKEIQPGDAIDFWRVLYANRAEGRLLLFAEMKLPGEAWLDFKIDNDKLVQTATFRPKGILGRFYWYSVYPVHAWVFGKMLNRLTQ